MPPPPSPSDLASKFWITNATRAAAGAQDRACGPLHGPGTAGPRRARRAWKSPCDPHHGLLRLVPRGSHEVGHGGGQAEPRLRAVRHALQGEPVQGLEIGEREVAARRGERGEKHHRAERRAHRGVRARETTKTRADDGVIVGFETSKLCVPTRGGIRLGAFATSRREVAVRPGYDGFEAGELARGDVDSRTTPPTRHRALARAGRRAGGRPARG